MQRNKTMHIIEVFMFLYTRVISFEEFISFDALFFIHEHLNSEIPGQCISRF